MALGLNGIGFKKLWNNLCERLAGRSVSPVQEKAIENDLRNADYLEESMSSNYTQAISNSGLTIYDEIEIGDPNLWVPTPDLEAILNEKLKGASLAGLALRTRSKVSKQMVCEALGYTAPKSFAKTQPRFVGQAFDTYVQKANNLQIWNEELSPNRRYVLIRVDAEDIITRVKVVTGADLATLDTTGTLTQKYQARLDIGKEEAELVSGSDTQRLSGILKEGAEPRASDRPTNQPNTDALLPISDVFDRLRKLIGTEFPDAGRDQERNRGAALHGLVCKQLGYSGYEDDGRFPDVRHQLLEVKLQTAPTIDLGLVSPDDNAVLDVQKIEGQQVRHCDVRYAIFYASTDGLTVRLTHFFLSTGEDFFDRFRRFEGKVLNKKLQIPLPSDFFDR